MSSWVCFPLWDYPPVTSDFPHKEPVMQSFGIFFDLDWKGLLTNIRVASELRRIDA